MPEQEHIILFKQALKDPQIEGLECICPHFVRELSKLVTNLPDNAWVSEWGYGGQYRYYRHSNDIGLKLKQFYDLGKRGGNPKLTNVYSKKRLEIILHEYQEVSEVQVSSA